MAFAGRYDIKIFRHSVGANIKIYFLRSPERACDGPRMRCLLASVRGRNMSVLDVERELPRGLQPPEQAPSDEKCEARWRLATRSVTLDEGGHVGRGMHAGAQRQLRFSEELAGLCHSPLTNPPAAHSRSESELYEDMHGATPFRRWASEPSLRPHAEASYVESLCKMSHELHMHRCHSEGSDDIFTIIRTPSKALAALMTPPLSPVSAASTRPASPGDLRFSGDPCPSSDGGLMGKIVDVACSLGGAARTFLSLLLWCCALVLGLLLVLSFIAMAYDLMATAELPEDYE